MSPVVKFESAIPMITGATPTKRGRIVWLVRSANEKYSQALKWKLPQNPAKYKTAVQTPTPVASMKFSLYRVGSKGAPNKEF